MSQSLPRQPSLTSISLRPLLERNFYFVMALLMVAVVVYGFSHTVEANLLHPAIARPAILYLHAMTFVAWLALFTVQSALVRSRRIRLHKQLGLFGAGLGAAVFVVGIATSLAMTRFHALNVIPGAPPPAFLIVAFNDIAAFGGTFGAAVLLRRKPEYHRRLMLMATAALTAAAWGRFPELPAAMFYLGVDGLILFGMARDLIVIRRVHSAYLYGLPAMIAGQIIAMTILMQQQVWWLSIVHAIGSGV
jgi:hypothetical protein